MSNLVLNINAVEAKGLPKMDVIGKCDPYLLFKLNNSKTVYKTEVIKKTYEPKWNQVIQIPISSAQGTTLHVELFDWDKITKHDLVSTHDFQINSFPLGKVIDMWYTFFAAPNVKHPGKVHLIFHLADKNDTPFREQFNMQQRSSELNLSVSPLNEEDELEAREQFKIIDINRNGFLEEDELDSYFRQSKQELRCFSKLVIEIFGKNGSVNCDQFLKFYKSLAADRHSDEFIGRYIFDYIDTDHSGTIELQEFMKIVDLIKFPDGFKQDTLDRIDVMNYEEFSRQFYTVLRIAWRGQFQRI